MLTIRLSRIGKKKKPMYRLIISEKARDPYGRALEILGSYNPFTKELQVKNDRVNYWLNQGAGLSATANNLLIDKKIIKRDKIKASIARKNKKEDKKEGQTEEAKAAAPAPEEKLESKPEQADDKQKEKTDGQQLPAESKEAAKKED